MLIYCDYVSRLQWLLFAMQNGIDDGVEVGDVDLAVAVHVSKIDLPVSLGYAGVTTAAVAVL